MKVDKFVACSNCPGSIYHVWDEEEPERCTCGRPDVLEEGMMRTTVNHVKVLRKLNWEKWVDWNPQELTREYTAKEMLQEEVQDYTCPMVIVGSDVVSLYPSMDVTRCSELMKEAILSSPIVWDNVDYLECARYVALNWSSEKCRASRLRRILPWRRKTRGSRPGI